MQKAVSNSSELAPKSNDLLKVLKTACVLVTMPQLDSNLKPTVRTTKHVVAFFDPLRPKIAEKQTRLLQEFFYHESQPFVVTQTTNLEAFDLNYKSTRNILRKYREKNSIPNSRSDRELLKTEEVRYALPASNRVYNLAGNVEFLTLHVLPYLGMRIRLSRQGAARLLSDLKDLEIEVTQFFGENEVSTRDLKRLLKTDPVTFQRWKPVFDLNFHILERNRAQSEEWHEQRGVECLKSSFFPTNPTIRIRTVSEIYMNYVVNGDILGVIEAAMSGQKTSYFDSFDYRGEGVGHDFKLETLNIGSAREPDKVWSIKRAVKPIGK